MAEREPDEGAARVGVGVRRPLAGEVRLEEEAFGAGLPALRLGEQLVVGRTAERRRSQASEPAAESITPIACQVPGTAWQNVCSRASGSGRYSRSAAKTTPDVPRTTESGPGAATPTPSAPGRLVARAVPTSVDSCDVAAATRRGISSASSTSSLQRRLATSKRSVPDASAASIERSPVSRRRT